MNRVSAEQWEAIRAERERGVSFGQLSAKHGVSKAAIVKRAGIEGWSDGTDYIDAVRRRATERAIGVTPVTDRREKAAAIDAAADEAAEVIRRHRADWAEHRRLFPLDAIKADFDLGKSAKISAELTAIRQAGERKSYGLDKDPNETTVTIDRGAVQVYLPHNGR